MALLAGMAYRLAKLRLETVGWQSSRRSVGKFRLISTIEHIEHERDFKVLCDGLLHFEVGPLVQTYSAAGTDKGIDAQCRGVVGGVEGRWVFQYKFSSPKEATSRRRAWLKSQYRPTRGKAGELDREGIAKADGYVLLTNIPMTVGLVHALEEQWRKRGKRGPFIVWDLLRLDAMLKGREHLARSWTGVKEARCRSHVIGPIWAWIERARHQLVDPLSWPVWPLTIVPIDERIHQPQFSAPISWRHSVGLRLDAGELAQGMNDPQFSYASTVAYPIALESLSLVERAQSRLVALLTREIEATASMLLRKIPELSAMPDDPDRHDLVTALAFGFLEVTWGFPRALHQLANGKIWVSATAMLPCPDVGAAMDDLVKATPHGSPPADVAKARKKFAAAIDEAWRRLWYVVEFGIDAEVEAG